MRSISWFNCLRPCEKGIVPNPTSRIICGLHSVRKLGAGSCGFPDDGAQLLANVGRRFGKLLVDEFSPRCCHGGCVSVPRTLREVCFGRTFPVLALKASFLVAWGNANGSPVINCKSSLLYRVVNLEVYTYGHGSFSIPGRT